SSVTTPTPLEPAVPPTNQRVRVPEGPGVMAIGAGSVNGDGVGTETGGLSVSLVGSVSELMATEPVVLFPVPTYERLPSGPVVIPPSRAPAASGNNLMMLRLVGLITPIAEEVVPTDSVNQMLPSGPTVRPPGTWAEAPVPDRSTWLKTPVLGV